MFKRQIKDSLNLQKPIIIFSEFKTWNVYKL